MDVQTRTSAFSRGIRTMTVGLAALAGGAIYAFKQFEDAENVTQQTAAVIESTGGAAKVTAGQVEELADALSRKAGVDDEVIQAGENMLLTFKNIRNEVGAGNDIFNQASVVALDLAAGYAAASGSQINLKSATIQLGKALNDPIAGMSALTRVGVQFTEQQQEQIAAMVESGNLMGAQKIILAEVTSQFGGSAEAQKTASGELRVAMENLAESVGAVLAPAIQKLVGWITRAAEWFTNLSPAMQSAITTAAGVAAVVALMTKAFGLLVPAIRLTIASLTVLAAHPIIALLVVFAATVALVATNWDKLNIIVKVALLVFSPVATLLGLLIRYFDDVKDAIVAFGEKAAAVFRPVLGFIQSIINAVAALVGWINNAVGALARLRVPDVTPGFDIPGVPFFQQGGVMPHTGLAFLHAGETIIPAGGGPGGLTVIINGDVTGEEVVKKVRDGLLRLAARNATTGL